MQGDLQIAMGRHLISCDGLVDDTQSTLEVPFAVMSAQQPQMQKVPAVYLFSATWTELIVDQTVGEAR